jgi:chromate transport protein ChrA
MQGMRLGRSLVALIVTATRCLPHAARLLLAALSLNAVSSICGAQTFVPGLGVVTGGFLAIDRSTDL